MAETFLRPRSRIAATCRNVWPKQQGNCSYGFKLEKPAGQAGAYRTQVGLGHVFPSEADHSNTFPQNKLCTVLWASVFVTQSLAANIHI